MAEIIINESQFEIIKGVLERQSKIKLAEDKWTTFSDEEKNFVIEFLKVTYPEKSKLLKEAWYNTLGDVVGIFDPTGVVDLVNGISYLTQGETLFGFLSIISAVPYAGDAVAKPVMVSTTRGLWQRPCNWATWRRDWRWGRSISAQGGWRSRS
jgi:hypothetical protein